MMAFIELLAAPFAACIVIASLHCYMGLHVVKRGVIFVDLSLAQMAALGAATALLLGPVLDIHPNGHHIDIPYGHETSILNESQLSEELFEENIHHEQEHHEIHMHETDGRNHGAGITDWIKGKFTYILSLCFAFLGALIFSLGRFRDERVPHEAIIGIVFVVSSALALLILSKAPHGHEKMEAMLVGSILFVSWRDVLNMLLLYAPLGVLHFFVRHIFMRISENVHEEESAGTNVRAWDLLFYASFALMVTQSVAIAGVLVVFSYLIIPAVCAIMFVKNFFHCLIMAWVVAFGASLLGLGFSAWKDMPTGPSLVAAFGSVLILCAAIRFIKHKINNVNDGRT